MKQVLYLVLQNLSTYLSYAQGRFIPAVKKYVHTIDATIEVDKPYIYPQLRDNDITIIEIVSTMQLTPIQME